MKPSDIWIMPNGLRVIAEYKPHPAVQATHICEMCGVAWNRFAFQIARQCGCDAKAEEEAEAELCDFDEQEPFSKPLPPTFRSAAEAAKISWPSVVPIVSHRSWKALAKSVLGPAGIGFVWLCQLVAVFWLEYRTMPEDSLADVVEIPGVSGNVIAAMVITVVFACWALLSMRHHKK